MVRSRTSGRLRAAALLTAAALLPAALAGAAAAEEPVTGAVPDPRPNVLVVMTDDQDCHSMGPAICGSMNPTTAMPKTVAWLGSSGTTYSEFSTPTPSCCQSRATFMTGQLPHNHGVRRLTDARQLDTATTVQAALDAAGYTTFLAGKYLNEIPMALAPPHFDEWLRVKQGDYYDPLVNDQGALGRAGASAYATTLMTDRADRFVREHAPAADGTRTPWYAYLAYTAPHAVNEAKRVPPVPEAKYADAPVEPWLAPAETDRSGKPGWVKSRRRTPASETALYEARTRSLYSVDDAMDRLRVTLTETGQLENTLVVYTSDNGFLLGEHGLSGKHSPYQPSVRVPTLLSWPARVPPGTVDSRLSTMTDLAPTIYAATGTPAPAVVDGRDLLDPAWTRSVVFGEWWSDPLGNRFYRTWRSAWSTTGQTITSYDDRGAVVFRERYDLVGDPHQLVNVGRSDASSDAAMAAYARCAGSTCP